jgi:hypothetical protein
MTKMFGSVFGTLYGLFYPLKAKADTALIDCLHLFDAIEIDEVGAMNA